MPYGIAKPIARLHDPVSPSYIDLRIEVGFRVGQQLRAASKPGRIDAILRRQQAPHANTFEAQVIIGGVAHGIQFGILDQRLQLRPSPAEQRAQQCQIGSRHIAPGTNARQTRNPASTVEAHHQRLGLIVELVTRRQCGQSAPIQPLRERGVTRLARLRLHITRGNLYRERTMRHPDILTQTGNRRGLLGAFRSQSVIDGRGLHPARQDHCRQYQQRKAVGSARYRDAEPRVFASDLGPHAFEIIAETRR